MYTLEFWKAVGERAVRGAAIAIAAAYFVGDGIFDALQVDTWLSVLSLAIGGAFGSIILSLSGYGISGEDRLSFNREEQLATYRGTRRAPNRKARGQAGVIAGTLATLGVVLVVLGILLMLLAIMNVWGNLTIGVILLVVGIVLVVVDRR